MEDALLIDPAVRMGAKVVALGLDQVDRQPAGEIAVQVGQGGEDPGTGIRAPMPACTAAARAGRLVATSLLSSGSSSRLGRCGCHSKAALMSRSRAERMMQPPRQIDATSCRARS